MATPNSEHTWLRSKVVTCVITSSTFGKDVDLQECDCVQTILTSNYSTYSTGLLSTITVCFVVVLELLIFSSGLSRSHLHLSMSMIDL